MNKEWFTRDIHFLGSGEREWIDFGDTFRIFPNMREVIKGITFMPELAGIIKKKSGISKRTQKVRMWSDEKEIRLKACIHQIDHIQNGIEFHDDAMVPIIIGQVVVKLTKNAFDTLYIYFPSTFIDKEGYIEKLKAEIPGMRISVMDESSGKNPLKNKE